MPIYEYRCSRCEAEFEELTSSSQADTARCQACGSRKVARLLSAFGVRSAESTSAAAAEPGGCGSCGAPQRGMCGMMN